MRWDNSVVPRRHRVVLEQGVLATAEDADGDHSGRIQVVAGGRLLTSSWWAIVLPGI